MPRVRRGKTTRTRARARSAEYAAGRGKTEKAEGKGRETIRVGHLPVAAEARTRARDDLGGSRRAHYKRYIIPSPSLSGRRAIINYPYAHACTSKQAINDQSTYVICIPLWRILESTIDPHGAKTVPPNKKPLSRESK